MSDLPCQCPVGRGFCGEPSDRFFYSPIRLRDAGDPSSLWARCRLHCHEVWAPYEVSRGDYLALEVLGS